MSVELCQYATCKDSMIKIEKNAVVLPTILITTLYIELDLLMKKIKIRKDSDLVIINTLGKTSVQVENQIMQRMTCLNNMI